MTNVGNRIHADVHSILAAVRPACQFDIDGGRQALQCCKIQRGEQCPHADEKLHDGVEAQRPRESPRETSISSRAEDPSVETLNERIARLDAECERNIVRVQMFQVFVTQQTE